MNWWIILAAFMCGAWVGAPFGYCFRGALEQANKELGDSR